MLPERAGSMPISAFSSVVLPMPLRPITATDSRGATPKDTSRSTCDSP